MSVSGTGPGGPIRRLASIVVDQIAAGEVVERPANIVKELLENSLDAGATRIVIDIEDGGIGLVRVSDDGSGMSAEDAPLALERHATSKLSVFDDLASLESYGFRGEALPSIASVSRFTLWTKTKESREGTRVLVAGEERSVEPAGTSIGTTVEVRDLFFNVPVRRKFLKSTATEATHVADVVLSVALCRPDVSFVHTRDGRLHREFLAARDRGARVLQLFPKCELRRVTGLRGELSFEAWLSSAGDSRAGASALYFVVNSRAVRDARLARAVANAYGITLEGGRYPAGVVFVDLPMSDVDVNAHPQKAEIRFRDARAVFEMLAVDVARSFGHGEPTTRTWGTVPQSEPRAEHRIESPSSRPSPLFDVSRLYGGASAVPPPPRSAEPGFFAKLRPLAMVRKELCVCEGEDALYIVDGHAAWERVALASLLRKDEPHVDLPVADTVSVEPAIANAIETAQLDARERGFTFERVGAGGVKVAAVPNRLSKLTSHAVMGAFVAELGTSPRARTDEDVWGRIFVRLACIAASIEMHETSMDHLGEALRALAFVTFSGRCTHDRPIVSRIGFDEIDRRVGR